MRYSRPLVALMRVMSLALFVASLLALFVASLLALFVASPSATAHSAGPWTLSGGDPVRVSDAASFNAAVSAARGGETIELADGAYPHLVVANRSFPTPVRIVGSRNATLAGITFKNSVNVVLKGVTVTPPASIAAKIVIAGSSRQIVIDRVLVDGRDESVGAFISTDPGTTDVTVRNSELTRCGKGKKCVSPAAKNMRILNNRFRDCRSCDFIRGGGGALIQGNSFQLARNVECTGGTACPHNNHIQVMGGGPWTIVGNSFGEYDSGPAQIYVNPGLANAGNPVHDVLIASNLFVDDTGVAVRIGIGGKSPTPPPSNVRVVNNTILTGTVRGEAAVLLHEPWDQIPRDQQPLFANNIFGKFFSQNCGRGRFVSNLVALGTPCASDSAGDPKLDAETHGPTAASALVIDQASRLYAPDTDFYGRPRDGLPDLGAIEFVKPAAARDIQLTVPPRLAFSLASLAKEGWRLRVTVGVRSADTLRGHLLRRGKTLAAVTARVTQRSRHTLVVPLPMAARRPGLLVLRLDAASASRQSISRSVTVRILGR